MPFPWNMWPWNRDSDLNVAYWIKQLEEISRQAIEDLTTLEEWKTGLEQSLETWKSGVLTSISTWENEFTAAMALWKSETEGDLDDWKVATQTSINQWEAETIQSLNAWKTAFEEEYAELKDEVEEIRDIANAAAQEAVDAAASISSSAAQIIANAGDIARAQMLLDEAFLLSRNIYNKNAPGVLSNKYMNISGDISDYNNRTVSDYIPVIPGKRLVISRLVSGAQEAFLWSAICFFDANLAVVTGGTYNNNGQIIPDGAAFARVTFSSTYPDIQIELSDDTNYTPFTEFSVSLRKELYLEPNTNKTLKVRLDKLEDALENTVAIVETPVVSVTDNNPAFTVGAMANNGTVYTQGYDSFRYSTKIPVALGDVVEAVSWEIPKPMRFLTAFAGNNAVPTAGGAADATSYTVTNSTITGVVATVRAAANVNAIHVTHQTGETTTYFIPEQRIGDFNWKGTLSANDRVYLPLSNVRYNTVWNFTGHIGTMGEFELGIDDGTFRTLAKITATTLSYRSNTTGTMQTVNHGLAIASDIRLEIIQDYRIGKLKTIRLSSGENTYELTDAYGLETSGFPVLKSNGGAFTDCAFSWIPQDIDKPIWIFGDSWISYYEERWIYYLVNNDFTSAYMLNGYSGENAQQGLKALKSLLKYHTPAYILWTYGMNDSDTTSAVNTDWKAAFDEVVQICSDYKIELILYTVPTTPTIKNAFKNTIIRNSGYRYIDAYAAMGANESGAWFTGYQDSSGNHTTIAGAKALYNRAVSDFPELCTL